MVLNLVLISLIALLRNTIVFKSQNFNFFKNLKGVTFAAGHVCARTGEKS